MPLKLEGTRYEVMGRLSYSEAEGKIEYVSWEYVLYNPDAGYLWLSEEGGHFTLSRVGHVRVAIPPIPVTKMKVNVGQETFRVYEKGILTLRWVDGAIPWRATVGEKTRYTHLIKPPEYLDQEITGSEVEIFRGRYVTHEEMEEAAGKDSQASPHERGLLLPAIYGLCLDQRNVDRRRSFPVDQLFAALVGPSDQPKASHTSREDHRRAIFQGTSDQPHSTCLGTQVFCG